VEIGGGFRVPDVLRQSGARLVEVGTTNRTYVADYTGAITDETAAVLRVHASNFAVVGFTSKPELAELARLAHERGVLALEDVGSGCLLDTASFGLSHEPTLSESIAAGVDIVCASGDKLLGGPQAGLILGRAAIVERIARHPLARALRADKTCLAGLAATLRHYARGDAVDQVPVWWSISRDQQWLRARVMDWTAALAPLPLCSLDTEAVVGGGSLPGMILPSCALVARQDGLSADVLARRLRLGAQPIVPRIINNQVAVDARTVQPGQDAALLDAIRAALSAA
jgi:L-seryl-tRNA(Ser) seleniumtransferase